MFRTQQERFRIEEVIYPNSIMKILLFESNTNSTFNLYWFKTIFSKNIQKFSES